MFAPVHAKELYVITSRAIVCFTYPFTITKGCRIHTIASLHSILGGTGGDSPSYITGV